MKINEKDTKLIHSLFHSFILKRHELFLKCWDRSTLRASFAPTLKVKNIPVFRETRSEGSKLITIGTLEFLEVEEEVLGELEDVTVVEL